MMRHLRFAAGTLALTVVIQLGVLLFAAVAVPLFLGLDRVVLTSGSMAPSLAPGDVVLADPDVDHPVKKNTVLVFTDPNRPGGLITHRVVRVLPDGGYRTKGDANPTPDSAATTPDMVVGQSSVLVPYVGLPSAWARQGELDRTVLALALVAFTAWLSRYGLLARYDPWAASAPTRTTIRGRSGDRRRSHNTRPWLVYTTAAVLVGGAAAWATPQLSRAAYSASTSNSGNYLETATGCSSPGSATVSANADAWLSQIEPAVNKGADTALRITSETTKNTRLAVSFALPTLPSGCAVTSATLRLFRSEGAAGRVIDARRITASWAESTITWNNQPTVADVAVSSTSPGGSGWQEWAVRDQVAAMYSSGDAFGFRLRDNAEGATTSQKQLYRSRENTTSSPELVVQWG